MAFKGSFQIKESQHGLCKKCCKGETLYKCCNSHGICYTCFHDLEKVCCPQNGCHQILKKVVTGHSNDIYIFVDNSNIWIEGKKRASSKRRLKATEDPRLRIDIGKLTDVISGGRRVGSETLYGSEPPKLDTVWAKIKEHGCKVVVKERSKRSGKEKQVDHKLVVDVTELVCNASIEKGTVVIVSGDEDIIPAVEVCLKKGWKCEVWTWKKAISGKLYQLQKECTEMKITELDSQLDKVTFTNYKFNVKTLEKNKNLIDQCAVLLDIDFEPDENWERSTTDYLGWPFTFCMIGEKSLDPKEYKDLIIVFTTAKDIDGKNAKQNFDQNFDKLKARFTKGNVVSYVQYKQTHHQSQEKLSITNRYDLLTGFQGLLKAAEPRNPKEQEGEACVGEDPTESDSSLSSGIRRLSTASSASLASLVSSTGTEDSVDLLNDNGDAFTTILRKKPKRNRQKFSKQCRHRGKCKKGRDCSYNHEEHEKRFFKNPKKAWLCGYLPKCKYQSRCAYAHDSKEGFCCECNEWGHLQSIECVDKNIEVIEGPQ